MKPEQHAEEDWLTSTEKTIGSALLRLALVLPEGRHYVSSLRKTVRCLLESVNVRREDIEDIELAIGELAANAMMHGDAPFTLGINYHTDHVVLLMADHGTGLPSLHESDQKVPLAMPCVTILEEQIQNPSVSPLEATPNRFGGWGLPVVHRITDRVEVLPRDPQGTIIRAEKRIRPAPYF